MKVYTSTFYKRCLKHGNAIRALNLCFLMILFVIFVAFNVKSNAANNQIADISNSKDDSEDAKTRVINDEIEGNVSETDVNIISSDSTFPYPAERLTRDEPLLNPTLYINKEAIDKEAANKEAENKDHANQENYKGIGLNTLSMSQPKSGQNIIKMTLSNSSVPIKIEKHGNHLLIQLVEHKIPDRLLGQHYFDEGVSDHNGKVQTLLNSVIAQNESVNGKLLIIVNDDFQFQSYKNDAEVIITINAKEVHAQQNFHEQDNFKQELIEQELFDQDIVEPDDPQQEIALFEYDFLNSTTDSQVTNNTEKPIYTGEPISVDFQNIEVKRVLHLLSQFIGINIVASDNVQGTVMLSLINVPWDQALDIILSTKKLGMQRHGNVIMVKPLNEISGQLGNSLQSPFDADAILPLQTSYIRLNYAKAEDVVTLIKQASPSVGDSGLPSYATPISYPYPLNYPYQDYPYQSMPNTDNQSTSRSDSDQVNLLGLNNQKLPVNTHATLNQNRFLESSNYPNDQTRYHLLSHRGIITADSRTNTLIIKDTANSIQNINTLIGKIDIPVQQVMIEAKIVSANDSFSKEIGVKWGMLSNDVDSNTDVLIGGNDQTLADLKAFSLRETSSNGTENSSNNNTQSIQYADNLNVDLGIANPSGSIALSLLTMSDLMIDLELSAMQVEGRGEVISTPRILTLDKQAARVSSGTKIPYQSESEGGGTTTQFVEAVLSLEVTPNITPEGRISMQLFIENGRPNPVGNGTILIDTDTLSTNVTVDNGQTIVLGGIYRNQVYDNVEKVPFFGDIPLVGNLFKKDMQRNDRQELLIFITPKLIHNL